MKKPNNPQAFPEIKTWYDDDYSEDGMTLLDYFAGQALNGIYNANAFNDKGKLITDKGEMTVSKYCYTIAEAMLKEREKRLC